MKKLFQRVIFLIALLIVIAFTMFAAGITLLSTLISYLGPIGLGIAGVVSLVIIVASTSGD